jgi:hypothetical protein
MRDPMSDAALKQIWRGMIQRCENPQAQAWRHYGGRGISVCKRWRESFEAFKADMGPRPSPAHTVDRANNDSHYEPGNCRWATPVEQARNTRTTVRVKFRGTVKALGDWTDATGVGKHTAYCRLRAGWPAAKALTDKSWGRRKRVAERLKTLRAAHRKAVIDSV